MGHQIYKWIAQKLAENTQLSQKGLANALGVNPSAVNRMLHGRRAIKVDEVSVIENYLGAYYQTYDNKMEDMDRFASAAASAHMRTYAPPPQMDVQHIYRRENASLRNAPTPIDPVPVYQIKKDQKDMGPVVDWVVRHPSQIGLDDSFALYIGDHQYAPRYQKGEAIYLHPSRPPEMGRDCLVERHDGAYQIWRYLGEEKGALICEPPNLGKKTEIDLAKIAFIYIVLGRG